MYSRPSTEVSIALCALRKKIGWPSTPLNARTGLCTPPGVMRTARSKYSRERASIVDVASLGVIAITEFNRRGRGGSRRATQRIYLLCGLCEILCFLCGYDFV